MRTTMLSVGAAMLLATCFRAGAQIQAVQEAETRFDAARLEQLVAPIALYPDSLLMHVLMAATYPLELVEAERFVAANPSTTGESLQTALTNQNWDPSVKSLAAFPDVLKMMSENLDWTRDLGDAFLAQRTELLDSVQRMRARARDAGTLVSTPQQTVTVRDDRIIVVEPARADVVYVPTYSPVSVYGGWSYPSYYYPGYYNYWPAYGALAFTLGFTFGWLWSDCCWGSADWRWGGSNVYVDANRFNRFNTVTGGPLTSSPDVVQSTTGGRVEWTHQPEHRRGVRYPNDVTARQFGVQRTRTLPREELRGFQRSTTPQTDPRAQRTAPRVAPRPEPSPQVARRPEAPRVERAPTPAPRQPDVRTVPRTDPRPNVVRPAPERGRTQATPRAPEVRPDPGPRTQRGSSAFRGSRNPSVDRQAVERGARSRGRARPADERQDPRRATDN